MGIWNKVKAVKNMMTGGGAKVSIVSEQETLRLGEPFTLTVRVEVADNDINIDKAYLLIRSVERIEAEGIEIEYEDGEREVEHEIVRKSTETFNADFEITGEQTLSANEVYEWSTEITLPVELNGSYQGKYAWHTYTMFAGLDALGNDPDSGWISFEIY
ncbi:sporulation protein [Marinibactrum halimedae]|uniref:Uncharacterized protein n=1 Tax=Marinibactrum halimedae TaxID=1444977 RepID=A0AA37WMQ3_9GAMM|nr:sporulation protein [Marinibactrum halimedae]MCD9460647.1 sporulation protein [Marinibactrum halimedae]GLS24292.1 hypothetical protein GCM10007877_00030 [Marinibactrum halimedae]